MSNAWCCFEGRMEKKERRRKGRIQEGREKRRKNEKGISKESVDLEIKTKFQEHKSGFHIRNNLMKF